uniref:Uncharacterized protein n=1 Tax=Anopheles epiroticus TaxID=199890 RepID=A0A182PJW1_9DIPT
MSRLLGDTAFTAAQSTVRLNRIAGRPLSSTGKVYYSQPTAPPEKKWLYKQVLESVQSGISPQLNLANSTLGRATSQMWAQLNSAQHRAQEVANEYHVKEKLELVMRLLASCVIAVKDFFALKQYYQLDRIIDKGLLALEENIRATREEPHQLKETAKPTEAIGEKVDMKKCTMVMVKRGPCPDDLKDIKNTR